MGLLDDVQALRELLPDSFELTEHKRGVRAWLIKESVIEAFDYWDAHYSDIKKACPNSFVLVSGDRIAGHGETWDEAYKMAYQNGYDPEISVHGSTKDSHAFDSVN
jgi:hypothetical protein